MSSVQNNDNTTQIRVQQTTAAVLTTAKNTAASTIAFAKKERDDISPTVVISLVTAAINSSAHHYQQQQTQSGKLVTDSTASTTGDVAGRPLSSRLPSGHHVAEFNEALPPSQPRALSQASSEASEQESDFIAQSLAEELKKEIKHIRALVSRIIDYNKKKKDSSFKPVRCVILVPEGAVSSALRKGWFEIDHLANISLEIVQVPEEDCNQYCSKLSTADKLLFLAQCLISPSHRDEGTTGSSPSSGTGSDANYHYPLYACLFDLSLETNQHPLGLPYSSKESCTFHLSPVHEQFLLQTFCLPPMKLDKKKYFASCARSLMKVVERVSAISCCPADILSGVLGLGEWLTSLPNKLLLSEHEGIRTMIEQGSVFRNSSDFCEFYQSLYPLLPKIYCAVTDTTTTTTNGGGVRNKILGALKRCVTHSLPFLGQRWHVSLLEELCDFCVVQFFTTKPRRDSSSPPGMEKRRGCSSDPGGDTEGDATPPSARHDDDAHHGAISAEEGDAPPPSTTISTTAPQSDPARSGPLEGAPTRLPSAHDEQLQPKKTKNRFKRGDLVKARWGRDWALAATVLEINEGGETYKINYKEFNPDDDDSEIEQPDEEMELIPKYSKGMKVQVVKVGSNEEGKIGTINKIKDGACKLVADPGAPSLVGVWRLTLKLVVQFEASEEGGKPYTRSLLDTDVIPLDVADRVDPARRSSSSPFEEHPTRRECDDESAHTDRKESTHVQQKPATLIDRQAALCNLAAGEGAASLNIDTEIALGEAFEASEEGGKTYDEDDERALHDDQRPDTLEKIKSHMSEELLSFVNDMPSTAEDQERFAKAFDEFTAKSGLRLGYNEFTSLFHGWKFQKSGNGLPECLRVSRVGKAYYIWRNPTLSEVEEVHRRALLKVADDSIPTITSKAGEPCINLSDLLSVITEVLERKGILQQANAKSSTFKQLCNSGWGSYRPNSSTSMLKSLPIPKCSLKAKTNTHLRKALEDDLKIHPKEYINWYLRMKGEKKKLESLKSSLSTSTTDPDRQLLPDLGFTNEMNLGEEDSSLPSSVKQQQEGELSTRDKDAAATTTSFCVNDHVATFYTEDSKPYSAIVIGVDSSSSSSSTSYTVRFCDDDIEQSRVKGEDMIHLPYKQGDMVLLKHPRDHQGGSPALCDPKYSNALVGGAPVLATIKRIVPHHPGVLQVRFTVDIHRADGLQTSLKYIVLSHIFGTVPSALQAYRLKRPVGKEEEASFRSGVVQLQDQLQRKLVLSGDFLALFPWLKAHHPAVLLPQADELELFHWHLCTSVCKEGDQLLDGVAVEVQEDKQLAVKKEFVVEKIRTSFDEKGYLKQSSSPRSVVCNHLHSRGWAAAKGKYFLPPLSISSKFNEGNRAFVFAPTDLNPDLEKFPPEYIKFYLEKTGRLQTICRMVEKGREDFLRHSPLKGREFINILISDMEGKREESDPAADAFCSVDNPAGTPPSDDVEEGDAVPPTTAGASQLSGDYHQDAADDLLAALEAKENRARESICETIELDERLERNKLTLNYQSMFFVAIVREQSSDQLLLYVVLPSIPTRFRSSATVSERIRTIETTTEKSIFSKEELELSFDPFLADYKQVQLPASEGGQPSTPYSVLKEPELATRLLSCLMSPTYEQFAVGGGPLHRYTVAGLIAGQVVNQLYCPYHEDCQDRATTCGLWHVSKEVWLNELIQMANRGCPVEYCRGAYQGQGSGKCQLGTGCRVPHLPAPVVVSMMISLSEWSPGDVPDIFKQQELEQHGRAHASASEEQKSQKVKKKDLKCTSKATRYVQVTGKKRAGSSAHHDPQSTLVPFQPPVSSNLEANQQQSQSELAPPEPESEPALTGGDPRNMLMNPQTVNPPPMSEGYYGNQYLINIDEATQQQTTTTTTTAGSGSQIVALPPVTAYPPFLPNPQIVPPESSNRVLDPPLQQQYQAPPPPTNQQQQQTCYPSSGHSSYTQSAVPSKTYFGCPPPPPAAASAPGTQPGPVVVADPTRTAYSFCDQDDASAAASAGCGVQGATINIERGAVASLVGEFEDLEKVSIQDLKVEGRKELKIHRNDIKNTNSYQMKELCYDFQRRKCQNGERCTRAHVQESVVRQARIDAGISTGRSRPEEGGAPPYKRRRQHSPSYSTRSNDSYGGRSQRSYRSHGHRGRQHSPDGTRSNDSYGGRSQRSYHSHGHRGRQHK